MSKDANVRSHLQKIAAMVNEELPEGWGFMLLAFPFENAEGRCNYVANCTRESGLKVMREFIEKSDSPDTFGKHI